MSGARKWIVTLVTIVVVILAWWLPVTTDDRARLWRTYRVTGVILASTLTLAAALLLYVVHGGGEMRRRVFRVIAVCFVVGLCLGVVEIPALLGHNYQLTFGTKPGSAFLQLAAGVNRADPELIHIHQPHSSYEGAVVGNLVNLGIPNATPYPVSVEYDHNGFRNATDLESAEIVAIGDSFLEAALVPHAQSVSEQIAARVGVPVANLGQAAYGFKQELEVLRRFGLPLEPRTVVWFVFGGNDLRDVRGYEARKEQMAAGPRTVPLRDRLFVGNALLALSRATTPARTEPSDTALMRSAIYTHADGTRERVYFGEGESEYEPYQWDVATETLTEARRLCTEAGAAFVVVYIPRKFRLYQEHVEAAPGTHPAEWKPSDLPERFAAWCRENEIPYVNLCDPLEAEIASGSHAYLYDDVHWNARGHEIAAEAVANALEELGLATRE